MKQWETTDSYGKPFLQGTGFTSRIFILRTSKVVFTQSFLKTLLEGNLLVFEGGDFQPQIDEIKIEWNKGESQLGDTQGQVTDLKVFFDRQY